MDHLGSNQPCHVPGAHMVWWLHCHMACYIWIHIPAPFRSYCAPYVWLLVTESSRISRLIVCAVKRCSSSPAPPFRMLSPTGDSDQLPRFLFVLFSFHFYFWKRSSAGLGRATRWVSVPRYTEGCQSSCCLCASAVGLLFHHKRHESIGHFFEV